MGRIVGYARVSTGDQTHALQLAALRGAGCDVIETDTISGKTRSRPALDRVLSSLQPGDTLTVWKLDRLGRSAAHLAAMLEQLQARGVEFRSITEGMDTRTPIGRAIFHIAAAFAQLERETIHERILAGIKSAKSEGTHCGRPVRMTTDRIALARDLLEAGEPAGKVARILGVARSTLYAAIARDDARKAANSDRAAVPKRGRGRPGRRQQTQESAAA